MIFGLKNAAYLLLGTFPVINRNMAPSAKEATQKKRDRERGGEGGREEGRERKREKDNLLSRSFIFKSCLVNKTGRCFITDGIGADLYISPSY